MSKHTQGEWGQERADIIAMPTQTKICRIDAQVDVEEMKANARLIAASPNLLAKLKQLCAVVGLTAFKYEGQRAALQEEMDEAIAVIKKAEGKS